MEVTARELKLRLGKCLAAVRAGEVVRITFRGKPVAEIRPLAPKPMSKIERGIAEGWITPGSGKKWEPIEPFPVRPGSPSGSEIISEGREDRI